LLASGVASSMRSTRTIDQHRELEHTHQCVARMCSRGSGGEA
jgi:hypothetical protein